MDEIPREFLTALSGDPAAMRRFCGLPEEEKDGVVQRARAVRSDQELRELLSKL